MTDLITLLTHPVTIIAGVLLGATALVGVVSLAVDEYETRKRARLADEVIDEFNEAMEVIKNEPEPEVESKRIRKRFSAEQLVEAQLEAARDALAHVKFDHRIPDDLANLGVRIEPSDYNAFIKQSTLSHRLYALHHVVSDVQNPTQLYRIMISFIDTGMIDDMSAKTFKEAIKRLRSDRNAEATARATHATPATTQG